MHRNPECFATEMMNFSASTLSKNKGLNTHDSSSSSTWSRDDLRLSAGKKVCLDEKISSVDINEGDISRKRIVNFTGDSEEEQDEVFLLFDSFQASVPSSSHMMLFIIRTSHF